MNTLQQEQNVNPAFDENVLKAAGRAAQIEQKAVVIASNLLDAVMVAYDEDKPNKALVPVFIQHITEAIATARADVAQQCYLECLAVECGEGECARAIRTKFNLKGIDAE